MCLSITPTYREKKRLYCLWGVCGGGGTENNLTNRLFKGLYMFWNSFILKFMKAGKKLVAFLEIYTHCSTNDKWVNFLIFFLFFFFFLFFSIQNIQISPTSLVATQERGWEQEDITCHNHRVCGNRLSCL